jgi:site-specific DNA-methyltransferase (adenine-specific)
MGGDFSDGELAWTSFDKVLKSFSFCNKEFGKKHPTQKPLELMYWILSNYAKDCKTVIDPFAGSFTTARACKDMGLEWIAIDKEIDYCMIGKENMRQEVLFEKKSFDNINQLSLLSV